MSDVKTDAIVLRHADYGETDRMVTLLTPFLGKLSVKARGCRTAKSKLTNATEIFCAGEYMLSQRQERYTLTGCTIKNPFYDLRCDYDRLTEGAAWLRMAETVANPGDENPMLFALLLKGLTYLNYSETDPRYVSLAFHMHFCAVCGFAPELSRCVVCGKVPKEGLRFSYAHGGLACEDCTDSGTRISSGVWEVLRGFSGVKFAQLASVRCDDAALDGALSVMRQYVRVILDR